MTWMLVLLLMCSPLYALDSHLLELEDPLDALSLGPWVEVAEQVSGDPSARDVYHGRASLNWARVSADVVNIGFSENPFWFRVNVSNLTDFTDWYLSIDLPLISELDVYVLKSDGLQRFYHLGDRFEFAARPIDHRNYIVPLALSYQEPTTLYVRIKSGYSIQLPAYLVEKTHFIKREITGYLLHGLFFGFLLVMLFYNGFLFFSTRDLSYLYYSCFTLSVGLFQFAQHGFGYQYLWPAEIWFQHRSVPVFSSLSFVFGGLFVQSFLNTRSLTPWFDKLIRWFVVASLLMLLVALFLSEFWAQAINAYMAVVGSVLLFVIAIMCWRRGAESARFFVLAWLVFIAAIITFAGNKMGIFPRTFLTEYGMQIGTAIELALLSFALADRINQSRRKQEELLRQSQIYEQIAEAANARALNYERMGKQRLEKNIKTRTEQLQAALKDLTVANRQLEAMSTFDALTGVRNLNFFNDRLTEEWTRATREKSWLSLMLVLIDDYELIADRYGYVAAEEILKLLAGVISERVARPADLVARTAAAEFSAVMPNTLPEGAGYVAGEVYDYVSSQPLNLGIVSISVNVTIVVLSQQPQAGEDVLTFLGAAHELLVTAIEEGGNRIKAAHNSVKNPESTDFR